MEKLPVCDPEFWKKRLEDALSTNEIHKSVYEIDEDTWSEIGRGHRKVLANLLSKFSAGIRVLDCGCGYGDLINYLPGLINYTGVDISPDLIAAGKNLYPELRLKVADLRSLPFSDRSFDVAICRAVEGMIVENLGAVVWHQMEQEILRVADRLIILSYINPTVARVVDAVEPTEEFRAYRIDSPHGYITYRVGKDGTCEIYDLMVEESYRRKGEGRLLIERLFREPYNTFYGFTRQTNELAMKFYKELGFNFIIVDGFYRGMGAVMFVRQHTSPPGEEQKLI